jgi:excisionase family DNA binding protein
VREAAAQLSLSARTLWAAIADGRLNALRFGKRATRLEVAEIERFVERARAS